MVFRTVRKLLWGTGALAAVVGVHLALLVGDGLRDEPGTADLAVVLGNQVLPDGTPSRRLALRLDRALALYREGRARYLLVSGGIEPDGRDEARVMADYLVARGVPPDRVVVDPHGVDTWATARKTREVLVAMGLQSVVAVTHYYHVPRTRLALQRFGVAQVYTAHVVGLEPREPYSLLREVPAWYWYRLRPGE